ncbi:hypothetical protein PAMA_015766 [Pampus argenteus]
MRTKVIRLVTSFMLVILLPVSADTVTQNSTDPVTTLNNTATSTEAPGHSFSTNSQATMSTKEDVMQQNDTTPTSPSLTQHTPVSYSSTTSSASKTNPKTEKNKLIIFLSLLGIMGLMVFIGCIHAQREQPPRLLLSMRERLRVRLNLCSAEKTGGEDQEEAEERQGDTEEGSSIGVRNEVKVEQKEELSDSSDDYSSMEGDDLRERALSRWEEEQKKQSRNDDGEETSSASQEIALVNSPKEDDEKADLTDVTIL